MPEEAWTTDEDLVAAALRFGQELPGYELPVAYGVARLDAPELEFGYVNRPGGQHLLPAVVLASVCRHTSGTATYKLTLEEMADAVSRLAPAEAATHHEHPNLWSWRTLITDSQENSMFFAVFVHSLDDEPVDDIDVQFRRLIASLAG